MEKFEIRIKRAAAKELAKLSNANVRRILQRIQTLQIDPRPFGAIKLAGRETYRIRQGDYRILYDIFDDVLIIQVIQIGHRSDVYRN